MARVTRMTKRRLGEILRVEGLISAEQLAAAMAEQRRSNLFLCEALVKLGSVNDDAIAMAIVKQFSLPFINASQYDIKKELLMLFPKALYWEYQFLPLDEIGASLIIVGSGLMNHDILNELERICGRKIYQYVGAWNEIKDLTDKLFKEFKPEELKHEKINLSELGSLLLDEEDLNAVTEEGQAVSTAQARDALDSLESEVEALTTGGASSVVQEALEAVEADLENAIAWMDEDGSGVDNGNPKPERSKISSQTLSARLSAFSGVRPSAFKGNPTTPQQDK